MERKVLGVILSVAMMFCCMDNVTAEQVVDQKPVPVTDDPAIAPLLATQNAFNTVAATVYPAVVSITTVQVERVAGQVYYIPFGNTLLNEFVGDIFGFTPDGGTQADTHTYFQRKLGIGSGIIVDPDGYIVTNYHMVADAENDTVSVRLSSNAKEYQGKIIAVAQNADLALIKIDETNLPAVTMANSTGVKVGDWAIAIGNPYGFIFEDAQPTMTVGVVSALNRSLPAVAGQTAAYRGLIQTDASINLGNSGGPLVNIRGEVMGINVAIVTTTGGNQGIGFAIPSNQCRDLMAKFGKGRKYGWLGVEAQSLTQTLVDYFKLNVDHGVVVMRSIKGSPADSAGLREGDVITAIDRTQITDLDALTVYIDEAHVGQVVTLEGLRDGSPLRIDVTLTERPQSVDDFEMNRSDAWRGLKPQAITPELIAQYALEQKAIGVVVVAVEPGSPAATAGVVPGDVITKVDQTLVTSLREFNAAVTGLTEDVLIKTERGYVVVKRPA